MIKEIKEFFNKWFNTIIITIIIILIFIAVVLYYYLTIPITSVKKLPKNFLNLVLYGIVTRISDGDGFHFFHMPRFRKRKLSLNPKTIPIRIAAIDAPEVRKFKKEAQPLANESKKYLQNLILNKRIRIKILKIDVYDRIVAEVKVGNKNVGFEMLKVGLACVYIGKGAVYGKHQKKYEILENEAKRKKAGIWGLEKYISPMDYKKGTYI
ncbi:putative endonuclease lcl3 [Gurleya vavrai]